MHPADLGECVYEAKERGWDGGIMAWQARYLFLLYGIAGLMVHAVAVR